MNKDTQWEGFIADFRFWDRLFRMIFKRLGGDPYTPLYRFVKNRELADTLPYVGFPVYPGSWENGKQFIGWLQKAMEGMESVPYELILNSDPAYIYMRESSSMALNCLVIPHAGCGHSHFFKSNYTFKKSGADTIMQRMAKWQRRFHELENDPNFGIERLEYTLDAALVVANYCVEFSVADRVPEKELRRRLHEQVRELKMRKDELKTGFDAELIEKRIKVLEKRLKKDPINKIRDIGSFLLDPKHNPGLSQEERDIIEIAFEVARYFNGQMETKFMNEGFASWCHEKMPKEAQATLPANWWMELLGFWTMFDKSPLEKYTNPYGITLFLFKLQEEMYCKEAGEEIQYFPKFEVYPDPDARATKRAKLLGGKSKKGSKTKASAQASIELPADKTRVARDKAGNILVFTGEWEAKVMPKVDYSRIFDIVKNYRDTSFFREFLTNQALDQLNDRSLGWINEQFRMINNELRKGGWNPETLVHPVPKSLVGKMQGLRKWMALSQASQAAHQETGAPLFPAPDRNLQWIGELLQLISAYESDKTKFKQQLLLRLGNVNARPDIAIVDGGIDSENDGTLVFEHQFDERTGFLKPSWTEKALEMMPRLWKRGGVKMLTKEGEVDRETGDIKNLHDFWYLADRAGKVTKGKVS